MGDTEELIDYLRDNQAIEVDHAFTVYIEPGMRLPWRDTKKIRECGYKIQDVSDGEHRTQLTLVRDSEDP